MIDDFDDDTGGSYHHRLHSHPLLSLAYDNDDDVDDDHYRYLSLIATMKIHGLSMILQTSLFATSFSQLVDASSYYYHCHCQKRSSSPTHDHS
jgi:hypothetical protein